MFGLLPVLMAEVQAAIDPIDDVRASAWYRRRMIDVLLRDVLRVAVTRATTKKWDAE